MLANDSIDRPVIQSHPSGLARLPSLEAKRAALDTFALHPNGAIGKSG
jgi:hypothetical protein